MWVVSKANDTRTRNRYRKLVPENLYQFSARSRTLLYSVPDFGTRKNLYRFVWHTCRKLVQVFWYRFSVPVSGACVIGFKANPHRRYFMPRSIACFHRVRQSPFIATQLNSTINVWWWWTRRRVEFCRYRRVSIATQLNSTQLTQLPSWTAYSQSARSRSVVFLFMTSPIQSLSQLFTLIGCTLFNWVTGSVELSWLVSP